MQLTLPIPFPPLSPPALPLPSLSSQLCLSYPEEVIVPMSSSDEDIKKVASFRHLGRFPVLAFHHKNNQVLLLDLSSLVPRLPGNVVMTVQHSAVMLLPPLPLVSYLSSLPYLLSLFSPPSSTSLLLLPATHHCRHH